MGDESSKDPMAEIMFEMVRSRYGDRLTDDQLDEVRDGVAAAEALAEELRKVRLSNSVEPHALFQPYRGVGNDE